MTRWTFVGKVMSQLLNMLSRLVITFFQGVSIFKCHGCSHHPKILLIKVKVESEKVGLKLNIQKNKVMASGPITSWEIDVETVDTVSDIILGGSKITADGDCSHEIKRILHLRRKVLTNLDSIL